MITNNNANITNKAQNRTQKHKSTNTKSYLEDIFRATHYMQARYLPRQFCLSVCPSVTFVVCVSKQSLLGIVITEQEIVMKLF